MILVSITWIWVEGYPPLIWRDFKAPIVEQRNRNTDEISIFPSPFSFSPLPAYYSLGSRFYQNRHL